MVLDLSPQEVLQWQILALDFMCLPTTTSSENPTFRRYATFDGVHVGQFDGDAELSALWEDGGTFWKQTLPTKVALDWGLLPDPREH